MADLIVFQILIPLTDGTTGIVHAPEKFDDWVIATVDRFGGLTVLGLALEGHWYDPDLPTEANPVKDHSNWYKIAVKQDRLAELRLYVEETARTFGQKCIYFEKSGEAEFVWNPALRPPSQP